MASMKSIRMHDHFAELAEPRRGEAPYPLINVVVIALCAVICGADDFVAIAKFGRTKRQWLSCILHPASRIPHLASCPRLPPCPQFRFAHKTFVHNE